MQFEVFYRSPEQKLPQRLEVTTFDRDPLSFEEATQSVNSMRRVLGKPPIEITDVVSSKQIDA